MEKLTAIKTEECPKHKGEFLSIKNLIIKSPEYPEGEGMSFFNYCKKENKYHDNKKFVSAEETALNFINKRYNKNYKLSEIEVITLDELIEKHKRF